MFTHRLLVLATAATLTACANTSQVHSQHVYPSTAADTWAIHAQTVEPEHRGLWEKACTKAWEKAGLNATPAATLWPNGEVQREHLEQAKAAGFTQLLVLDTRGLLLSNPYLGEPSTLAYERNSNTGGQGKFKTYRDQVDDNLPQQEVSVEVYPLNGASSKPQHLTVDSHEANELHKIARSQCQALAEFVKQGQRP